MGILRGDVEILGLGTLLQALTMNGREGVLTLSRDTERKTIYFGPHGIRLLSTTMKQINRLGKILLRRRKISVDDLKALLEEQRLVGWKLGEIAIDTGKITRKDLEEALQEQVEEEIFDLFMWPDATFEFQEGPPREKADNPLAELTLDVTITHVVLEAARRQDELRQIRRLVNDEMIVLLTGEPIRAEALGDVNETARTILPLIDGNCTVREIVQYSIYPRFATMRAVYALIAGGFAKVRSLSGTTVTLAVPTRQKGQAQG
ncbi:MAG: DUF4388 domain-containing protein [Planctomycetes bacterium]|nr:DUF4388 domain-containing protein [Planctomycetota bacterium]